MGKFKKLLIGIVILNCSQGFPFSKILEAHEYNSDNKAFDDVELAKKFGLKVIIKTGHKDNMKITTPDDFLIMSKILIKKFER